MPFRGAYLLVVLANYVYLNKFRSEIFSLFLSLPYSFSLHVQPYLASAFRLASGCISWNEIQLKFNYATATSFVSFSMINQD